MVEAVVDPSTNARNSPYTVWSVYTYISMQYMYRESEKNSSHVLIVIDANALEEHTYLNNGDRYCNQTHKQDTSTHYFPVEMLP